MDLTVLEIDGRGGGARFNRLPEASLVHELRTPSRHEACARLYTIEADPLGIGVATMLSLQNHASHFFNAARLDESNFFHAPSSFGDAAALWFELDRADIRSVEATDVVRILQAESDRSIKGLFHHAVLVELTRGDVETSTVRILEHLSKVFLNSFQAWHKVETTNAALPSPADAAAERRNHFLAAGWPSSMTVGKWLGGAEAAAEQRASRARADRKILGAWGGKGVGFVHPQFQFDSFGQPIPRLEELMDRLGELQSFAPDTDRGGWRRVFWLYQPRPSLSERSIAESRSTDPLAMDGNFDQFPDVARTPAEVFATDPEAVFQLIRMDAEAERGIL